jgi:ATP-binding cassette, subfamily C (CFTR/MRP), member 10
MHHLVEMYNRPAHGPAANCTDLPPHHPVQQIRRFDSQCFTVKIFKTQHHNIFLGFIDYIIYLQAGTKAITWFVHLGLCLVLRSRITLNTRGPSLCNFLWFQTFNIDIMIFRTCLINREPTNLLSNIDYISSLSTVVLQVFYLATLLSGMWNSDGVSSDQQRNLLNTSISGHSYSQFQEDMDPFYLGIAKEGSSFLSRLFFHWVTPLMDKGVAAKLTSTDELFDLPPNLSTRQVSKKFVQVLASYPAGEKKNTLLRALHRCYGVQFYSIGVLKLLADLAGFASPMLLNGLVKFIEDKNESIELGLMYAGGLFLASTIGS